MAKNNCYKELLNPFNAVNVISKESVKTDSRDTLTNSMIGSLLMAFATMVSANLMLSFPVESGFITSQQVSYLTFVTTPLGFLMLLFFYTAMFYAGVFILYRLSIFFGSKGNFKKLSYTFSLFHVLIGSGAIAALLFATIPLLNLLVPVLVLFGALYVFYLQYVGLRTVHKELSRMRAVAVYLVSMVVYAVAQYGVYAIISGIII